MCVCIVASMLFMFFSSRHDTVERLVAGIAAVFLSLRRRPAIRFQAGSESCKRVAMGLYNLAFDQ